MDDERTGKPIDDGPTPHHDRGFPASESEGPTADPRTTIAGRYAVDLQAPPTNAGIAVAHPGRDLRTRDPVVVKTLRLEYRGDPEMRARFRREARLLQFLSHPNVVRALTFVEERGAPWLVLERVPGRTLREEIDAGAPFSPEEAVPVLRGLAAALDHLHARGLAHLDVRPENVVVTPDGEVKLIDFGVAQTAGAIQESADTGGLAGAAYLAPEQLCGEPVGAATDVYALGCIIYEMLTGSPPFPAGDDPASRNAAVRLRLQQTAPPPSAAPGQHGLPAWVDDVLLEALERDPPRRFSSAGSFATLFRSGVEGRVDVETGRPRLVEQVPRARRVPLNEPAIAVRGSPRLASRRGGPSPASADDRVVEASFSPLSPATGAAPVLGRTSGPDLGLLRRRLWQAVILAVILNVIVMAALLATRGTIPVPWNRVHAIAPGDSVQIAGSGLVARAAPDSGSAIVADLPEGGTVRIAGPLVTGADGRWWPIEVTTATGVVSGYVPDSWVSQP